MRKLCRSRTNRVLAGVAGGLAEYFEVDSVLIRLLWLLSILFAGTGVVLYIAAWIVIPEENGGTVSLPSPETGGEGESGKEGGVEKMGTEHNSGSYRTAGILLVGIGLYLLADNLVPAVLMRRFWPVVLIALGVLLLLRK